MTSTFPKKILILFLRVRSAMAPYLPDGDPLCFTISAILHKRNQIDTDEYLDRMLAHLSGSRHPEDTPTSRIRFDPLSIAIQNCLFDEDFSPIEGKVQ
jgi:hypothetical protein